MKKISTLCLAAALIAAIAVPGLSTAQDTQKPEEQAYALKRLAKKDESAKFKAVVELTEEGETIGFSHTQDEKILSVDKDGTYEVEEKISDEKMTYEGEEIEMDDEEESGEESKPGISVYDSRNILVEVKDEESKEDEFVYRRSNSLAFVAPEKAVKVGDEWTYEFKENDEKKTVAGKSTFKVEAFEKVGGRDTMKIKFQFEETDGSEPISTDVTIWVDVKDGNTVKLEGTFKNFLFPDSPALDGKVTVTREG